MADDAGVIDRLVVGVSYAYDKAGEAAARSGLTGVATAAAGAGLALVGLAYEAALAGDEAHDMGIRMGLSASEVTAWSYAADRAGASVEVLSQGLITLQRNLGAAREGAGPAAEAFKKLKIDPREIQSADDALFHIADRLQTIDDEGERATLRLTLLGEAGPRLAELLGDGSQGIEDLLTRAERLGVVISDADADLSGDFLDSLSDLGEIGQGVGRRLGFALLPALKDTTAGLRDWYLANSDVIDQRLDLVIDGIGKAASLATTPLGRLVVAGVGLGTAWKAAGTAEALATAAAASGGLGGALAKPVAGALALAKRGGPLAVGLLLAVAALDDLSVAADDGDAAILRLAETMGVRGETQDAIEAIRDLLFEAAAAGQVMAGVIGTELVDAMNALAETLPSLQPLADLLASLDLGGAIEAGTERVQRARKGFELTRRYYSGDPSVRVKEGRQALQGVIGADPRSLEALSGAGGMLIAPSISIQAGMSRGEIVRAAKEEVGRQVNSALQTQGVD